MKSFLQFVTESEGVKSDLENYTNHVKSEHGVDLGVTHYNGHIHVHKIVVPKDKRGSGIGSTVMRGLTDIADKHKARTLLTPATDFGGSSVKRLKSFYKGHGFVENKGKNKDYSTQEGMFRDPT